MLFCAMFIFRSLVRFTVLVGVCALAACGGGGEEAPSDSSGACTSVVNGGALVPETAGTGSRPVAAGGTIEDGTYFLTKSEVYAPGTTDAAMRKRVWMFAGNRFEAVNNDSNSAERKLGGTKAANGTMLTLTVTCPMDLTATIEFTATGTTFTEHASGGQDLFVFTKQ